MKRPLFVFDIDGVVLDWFSRLGMFLDAHNIVHAGNLNNREFIPFQQLFQCSNEKALKLLHDYNGGELAANLTPMSDLVAPTLNKLAKIGDVVAVTCIGLEARQEEQRVKCLNSAIGEGVFSDVICLDVVASKYETLKELNKDGRVVLYVDDRLKHIEEAKQAGIQNAYQFTDNQDIPKVKGVNQISDWKEVDLIAKSFERAMMLAA